MTAPGTAVGGAGRAGEGAGDGSDRPPARRCSFPGARPGRPAGSARPRPRRTQRAALPPPGAPSCPEPRRYCPVKPCKESRRKARFRTLRSPLPRASPGSGPAESGGVLGAAAETSPKKILQQEESEREERKKERAEDVNKRTKNDLRKCLPPSSAALPLPASPLAPAAPRNRVGASSHGGKSPGRPLPAGPPGPSAFVVLFLHPCVSQLARQASTIR